MNLSARELYDFLESSTTQEIRTYIFMSVRYLVKNRNENMRNILKEIKNINKKLDKEV